MMELSIQFNLCILLNLEYIAHLLHTRDCNVLIIKILKCKNEKRMNRIFERQLNLKEGSFFYSLNVFVKLNAAIEFTQTFSN